jgi:SAM-dependent methyltransferase
MMREKVPKPSHLSRAYASQFQDAAVADAYRHRPPYPDDLYPILAGLIGDHPRRVLELGTGTGAVARGLADLVDHVDAVDFSVPLLDIAKTLPDGDRANIRWIHAFAEDAPLDAPYGLATAGSSLHWMDWYIVLPRVKTALAPGAWLAIFDEHAKPLPWGEAFNELIPHYSTNREFRPYNLIDELTSRQLFQPAGRIETKCMRFTQTIDEHVESMHARNGFSRDRMTPANAAEFDARFKALVQPHCRDDLVRLEVFTTITYGLPCN